VTSDTEARSEEATVPGENGDESTAPDLTNANAVAARFLRTSVGFLALGLLVMLALAVKRVAPDFLGGVEYLSYGRLAPAATSLLLYGWLTLGLLGALFFVVSRSAGADIEDGIVVQGALGLLALAYLAGPIAVVAGFSEGRRYLEAPLPVDVVTLLGLLAVARTLTRLARKTTTAPAPQTWYAAAAVIWLVVAHIVGNIPGLTGYASQLQTSFYRSSLIGLWMSSAALAVVYYAIPKIAGRPPIRATRLSVLGIWSLGFTWAMTGPAELTFGAAGDWLETIGVIFSIVLFLPLLVIGTDLTQAMRGAWQNVHDRASLRFFMAGLAMFAVFALFNLTQALRASAAVVGFTDWVAAVETIVLFGPFTFVLLGLMRVARADLSGYAKPGMIGYRISLLGLGVTTGAMAIAGVQTGFTWAGAANTAAFANSGDGWISTARPLEGNYIVQLVGLAILAVGVALAIRSATGKGGESLAAEPLAAAETEPDLVLDPPPSLRKVRRYAYGFFALAALLVLVLPALETEQPTLFAEARDYRPGAIATGRAIYIQEGCAYCHSQQVRPIVTDVGLGPVSILGDYAKETPVLVGVQRYGPDLTHLGDRADAAAVVDHLRDPQQTRPWSIMPSYDYLGGEDLNALAEYLAVGEE